MSHVKLIIFDLDGTTADTLDGICEAVNRTMRELGYPLHTRQSVQGFVNYGVEQFCREMLPPAVREDAAAINRAMGIYLGYYNDTYTMTVPYEGVAGLLERLSRRTLLAMNSNKQDEFVRTLADRLFRPGLFLAAEGFRTDRPGKPDPTMALQIMAQAAARLGEPVTPEQCVYVGDSDIDVRTARNAGMKSVSVSWGYRSYDFLRALGDQPIARNPGELEDILLSLGV